MVTVAFVICLEIRKCDGSILFFLPKISLIFNLFYYYAFVTCTVSYLKISLLQTLPFQVCYDLDITCQFQNSYWNLIVIQAVSGGRALKKCLGWPLEGLISLPWMFALPLVEMNQLQMQQVITSKLPLVLPFCMYSLIAYACAPTGDTIRVVMVQSEALCRCDCSNLKFPAAITASYAAYFLYKLLTLSCYATAPENSITGFLPLVSSQPSIHSMIIIFSLDHCVLTKIFLLHLSQDFSYSEMKFNMMFSLVWILHKLRD